MEKITVYDMVFQIINSGQLTLDEETKLLGNLRKRQEDRESVRLSRCLAGVIAVEMQHKVEDGTFKESSKKRTDPIYRRCFKETEVGNMDASELSATIIKEFIMDAHESFGLSRNEMYFFMGMLQMGVNKMADLGLLTFAPDKKMYRSHVENDRGIRFIENPYSKEETSMILEWVENNFSDTRGLAVALWLSSDISPEEIVSLKKEDCWSDESGKEMGSFKEDTKKRLINAAFKLHPENEEYIFMVKKDGRWRKLNERSLNFLNN